MPSSPSSPASPSDSSKSSSPCLGAFAVLDVGVGLFAARLDLALALLALVLAFLALVLLVGALVLAAALIGIVGDHVALDQFEILEQFGREAGKGALIVDREPQRIEIAAGLLLDPLADQRQAGRGDRGRFARRSAARGPSAECAVDSGTSSRLRARVIGSERSFRSSALREIVRRSRHSRATPNASTRAPSTASNTARATASAGAVFRCNAAVVMASRSAKPSANPRASAT